MPKSRPLVVVAAAAVLALSGCFSGRRDKAGGSDAPVVLRIATGDLSQRPEVEQPDYFAQQVARLSHGALRVEIARGVLHESVPDTEGRLIEAPG